MADNDKKSPPSPSTPTTQGKEKEKRLIVYIGIDQRFWKNIKNEIMDAYGKDKFVFEEWFAEGEKTYLIYYRKVIKKNPKVIYLDFSDDTNNIMNAAFLLKNSNTTKHIQVIGLHQQDAKEIQIRKTISQGVHINHFKSGTDYYDPVYSAFSTTFPTEVQKSPYFLANYAGGRDGQMRESVRVNYFMDDIVHIECGPTLTENSIINMETYLPPDLVPSTEYEVREKNTGDHYYMFEHKGKLAYQFLDRIEPKKKGKKSDSAEGDKAGPKKKAQTPKDIEKEEIELRAQINNREFKLKEYVKNFSVWLKEMREKSIPKHLKIMVIDEKYEILDQAENWIDDYPYSFRLQTLLDDPQREILNYRPSFIMFNYNEPEKTIEDIENERKEQEEKEKAEQAKAKKAKSPYDMDDDKKKKEENKKPITNDINSLGLLINTLKTIPDYEPVVVSFNTTKYTSQSLQEFYKYTKIMVYPKPISFETILNMASAYENKFKFFNPATMEHADKFFVSKNDPLSFAHLVHEIKILGISETDFYFSTKLKLPLYSTFLIKSPAEFLITTLPNDKVAGPLSGSDAYRGIIHSITNQQKEVLRKHIIIETQKAKKKN